MGHGCSPAQKQTFSNGCCARDNSLRNELSVEYDGISKEKESEELLVRRPQKSASSNLAIDKQVNGVANGYHDADEQDQQILPPVETRHSSLLQPTSTPQEEGFEYRFNGFKWYFERELPELEQHPSSSSSSSPGRGSMLDTSSQPAELRPLHTFSTSATYHGWWRGNTRHGEGVQTWPDGARYEGQWVKNRAEGQGRFTQANGDVYIGEWLANRAHGLGTYCHNVDPGALGLELTQDTKKKDDKKGPKDKMPMGSAISYTGQWVDDLQHGVGVERWKEGLLYEGTFRWGQKEGHGIYRWSDGSTYRGEFLQDTVCGYGVYCDRAGQECKGQWQDGNVHGTGKYSWPNGEMYAGQWVEDQRQGFGIFRFADGRRFDGYWHEGQQHGEAIIESKPDGKKNRGEPVRTLVVWRHGKRVCAGSRES